MARIAGPYKLATTADSALAPPPAYFPGVQAWYNQYIQADPDDANHVYLGLEEVYESTDGGRTWSTIGPYWNFDISCNDDGTTPYACPPTTHPDQHAITFKGRHVFVGNDGGVWRRLKSQHSLRGWVNLNKTLHTLQYYSAQTGRMNGGLAYWGGLQDNGETIKVPFLGASSRRSPVMVATRSSTRARQARRRGICRAGHVCDAGRWQDVPRDLALLYDRDVPDRGL